MTIYWSEFARLKLRDIFDFYKAEAGTHIARKLVSELIDSTILVEQNPEIGQREEVIQNRTEDFRYLVHSHYKILYWIDVSANRIVLPINSIAVRIQRKCPDFEITCYPPSESPAQSS